MAMSYVTESSHVRTLDGRWTDVGRTWTDGHGRTLDGRWTDMDMDGHWTDIEWTLNGH